MKSELDMARLYISAFLGITIRLFEGEPPEKLLEAPYNTDKENRLLAQFLQQKSPRFVCHIQDRLLVRYCLVCLEGCLLLLGPYRIGELQKKNFPAGSDVKNSGTGDFLQYCQSIPNLQKHQLMLAVHTMLLGLYGDDCSVEEFELSVSDYSDRQFLMQELITPEEKEVKLPFRQDNAFYYIAQIRSGNYANAWMVHRNAMRGRGQRFSIYLAIEGMTTVRNYTRIGLALAGVPDISADRLFAQFKADSRVVTSVEEANHICRDLIEKSCALVRQHKGSQYSRPIREAIGYIHANLTHELTVAGIADHVGLSPNRFSTNFHTEVGMTAGSYIQQIRMENAAELLLFTDLSIQEIGRNVGILDRNYFARCFRAVYSMTPSEFRQKGELPDRITAKS